MPTSKQVPSLTINKVESKEVYEYMASNGLINEDELYLVNEIEGDPSDVATKQYVNDQILANKEVYAQNDEPVDAADGSVWLDLDDNPDTEVPKVDSFNGRQGVVVPQSGDYTAAMVGAAPAGFGLGASVGAPAQDLNLALAGGIFWSGDGVINKPDGFSDYLVTLVLPRSNGEIHQTCYDISNRITAERYIVGGTFYPWEYANPPMLVGVEYRTMERYNGKPVYCKVVNCGAGPNSSYMAVAHGATVEIVVRCDARNSGGGSYPVWYLHDGIELIANMYADNIYIYLCSNYDTSALTMHVTIYYTKP